MLPDPIFRGEVSSSWLHVAQFREATGRDRASLTVFDAGMDPAPEGGTTLRGTVGPKRNNAMTMLVVAAVFAVAGLGAFVVEWWTWPIIISEIRCRSCWFPSDLFPLRSS
jgi:hypothetical protein